MHARIASRLFEYVFDESFYKWPVLRVTISKPPRADQPSTYLVYMEIDDRENSIRVALLPVAFHGRPDLGLCQYQVREVMDLQGRHVALPKLTRQPFYRQIVDGRVRVEEIKLYIDEALLGWHESDRSDVSNLVRTISLPPSSSSSVLCFLFDMRPVSSASCGYLKPGR